MRVPASITFRGLPHSDAVKTHIEEKVEKLHQYNDHITSCHVVVEFENKNQHRGNLYNTHVTLSIPGKEIVSTRNHDEDMYKSISHAFDDLIRQLENHAELLRDHTKNNQTLASGKIARLFDDYGFIETMDGAEFYFNKKHVAHPAFEKIAIGMHVHFIEGEGTDGPEAHRVRAITE